MFSKFQCGFQKCYGAHHCLLLKKKRKKQWIIKKVFGAVLTDVPKAFASISHDLLIATLYTHTVISSVHCVNSVRVWSFSGPCFPTFRFNTSSITLNTDTFHGLVKIDERLSPKPQTKN